MQDELITYHWLTPESDNGTEPQSQQHVACIAPDIVESTELESRTSTHEVVVASIFVSTPMENLYKIHFVHYNNNLVPIV